jgi:hypothetical protein
MFESKYWTSYWQDQTGLRIRLSTDSNYQICYIDFLDYGKIEVNINLP